MVLIIILRFSQYGENFAQIMNDLNKKNRKLCQAKLTSTGRADEYRRACWCLIVCPIYRKGMKIEEYS